jgi:hypothetical protein
MAPYLTALPAAGLVLAAVWRLRGITAATRVIAPAAIGLALVFYLRGAPAVSRVTSEAAIADAIAARIDAPIVSYNVTPASLMFYVDRRVERVSRPPALRRALAERQFAWIVTSPRHVEELARIARVYPWVTTGRHVLYATAPPATMAAAASGIRTTN